MKHKTHEQHASHEQLEAAGCGTYVAVGLVVLSSHSDGAVVQHGHDPLEVTLVDDASVVGARLRVVRVELLPEKPAA